MLRISKLADYGTVIMVYLARRAPTLCNARDIAVHTHLMIPTVSKLLKRLTAAGLLTSARGISGGYRLQRSASEISIAQIIYTMDTQTGLTECSMRPNACSLQSVCHVQGNWQLISQAIETSLESISLETFAKPALPGMHIKRIRQLVSGVNNG